MAPRNDQPGATPYFNVHFGKNGKIYVEGPYFKKLPNRIHGVSPEYLADPKEAKRREPNLDEKIKVLKQRISKRLDEVEFRPRQNGR